MDNGLYNSLREKLLYQETLDLDDEGVRGALTDLLDRESMMKPTYDHRYAEMGCSICGNMVGGWEKQPNYCPNCGQKLDWED